MTKHPPFAVLIIALALLVAALAFASMITGPQGAGAFDLIGLLGADPDTAWLIMREVRLPRTALAVLEGATLGLAGATLQGFLRNPLADPGVIGVSSSASLFAVIVFYAGLGQYLGGLALPLAAIAGAMLCVLVLKMLAGRGGV